MNSRDICIENELTKVIESWYLFVESDSVDIERILQHMIENARQSREAKSVARRQAL